MRAAIVAEPHTVEDGAYLVPLRLFIGLGWLRACAEKVIDPGWRDGSSLTAFLSHRLAAGEVAFPWYETLMEQVSLPHATALALVILLGQFLAGAAIAAGLVTNAALLGGLFMNLNFLLAGEPNPSTFYIVIQVALLLTHAGAILGLDAGLSKTIHNPLLVAQPLAARRRRQWRVPVLPIGAIALVTAVYALAHVTDWSPAGSVEDPAMIVVILALLTLAWATIAWLRQDANGRRVLRHRDIRVRPGQAIELPRAAGGLRLGLLSTAFTRWAHAAGSARRWRRSPQRSRRLALTVTLAWLNDDRDEPDSECRTEATPRTALRTAGRCVPVGSQFSPSLSA
jgi:uncharacterized membrane protein YphA (DoxX/SURF4 family)